ncbi:hypothetical protein CHS0354_032131 [Potamilus streckersoni]|uniref:Uncharacterized protein n=1 Tax=Potamilus streckersoni TaxID=2493646 RepID=A0AAE0SFQ6_9BIVA|nr:hypothetical protein CHS0354_032131 [Potamilus streckersoni]
MLTTVHILLLLFTTNVLGKATTGPCEGMNCLHGVLMHDDNEQGDSHVTEDQYLRFKGVMDTQKVQAGPYDAEENLHGVLMHGDEAPGKHHEEKQDLLPKLTSQAGPTDLNDYMHEVLMHNGEEPKRHASDIENSENKGPPSPPNDEQLMHGILMHGDAAHVHDDTKGEEEAADKKAGPHDSEELMHGLLMHGDVNQGHHHGPADGGNDKTTTGKAGPEDSQELMHGILMHGDASKGTEHEHDKNGDDIEQKETGPFPDDLHGILMHGDSEPGHDHTKEDEAQKHEVFRDISKILEMDLDKDLLKIIEIKNILHKNEEEYQQWLNNNRDDPNGNSYPYISDSLYNDIQLMKKRYLEQEHDSRDDDYLSDRIKEIPFTAEDATRQLDPDKTEYDPSEDARHQLELIGSTNPINARHKIHLEMKKKLHED